MAPGDATPPDGDTSHQVGDETRQLPPGDPALALLGQVLKGSQRVTFALIAAVLFGQVVTAILAGAGLAADLGIFTIRSTADQNQATAAGARDARARDGNTGAEMPEGTPEGEGPAPD